MTMELAIETRGLTKMFEDKLAVNALDLKVVKGSIYGFLGLNGAGKTTTIKMLLNLVYPTSGEAFVLGHDVVKDSVKIREKVGFVPEESHLYDYMRVSELIDFCRAIYSNWQVREVGRYLDLFELPLGKKVKELSKGMKNQLNLVLALGAGPELVILDEPTGGLDPVKTRDFFRVILEQVAEIGQTVFFSSHRLHEVERVADTVGIIHKGKLVFSKSLDDIKTNLKKIRVVFSEETSIAGLEKMPGVNMIKRQGRGYILECDGSVEQVKAKLNELNPVDIEVIDVGLEDVFMRYTGGGGDG
ncbi:ABC transporter ATP-binding protein [Thermincola potens]|uniref:ABC transporter related protein n=1 Tax=Thermincola potens (strain JR) TaxID=635013 RepID=D5XC83_THEPJ|nr:ABC transporter ATP-binding protein [Thermincola potens]ADG83535.1 ABC transporter related protein [Thermincola potens JR]